jgi:hypothetical protein
VRNPQKPSQRAAHAGNLWQRPRLRVGPLVDAYALQPGTTTRWGWPGGLTATITGQDGTIGVLVDGCTIPQSIPVEFIPNRRARPWMLRCPRCSHRAERLFEVGGLFLCQRCHRLSFVWGEPVAGRAVRLRRQIGAPADLGGPLVAPRHFGTGWRAWREKREYDRVAAKIRTLEARALASLVRFTASLDNGAADER